LSELPQGTHPEVIGEHVADLLEHMDEQILDVQFRNALKQSLKQLADVKFALDESSIVAVTNRLGRIQYLNDKFCEISKYSREELLGQDHRIINSGYHGKAFMKTLWDTISAGQVWRGDIKNRAKDGSYYWVNTTIVPFLADDGQPYQFLAIRNEVTQLKKVEEELQLMMAKVMEIQEAERRRFSRELHDGIGQTLFSLLIQVDRLISDSGSGELQPIRQQVSSLMEDVRGLAWELRPSVLDDLGVVPAIRTYIDNYTEHYGIRVQLTCNLRKRLIVQQETTIYRTIQEALTNVAKYAAVQEAHVFISETESSVEVGIEDRGNGFIHDGRSKGVGLFSMEERARSVGGQLDIKSEPGQGTMIQLVVPKSTYLNIL
jgi:PAS domain S-box-containing protein